MHERPFVSELFTCVSVSVIRTWSSGPPLHPHTWNKSLINYCTYSSLCSPFIAGFSDDLYHTVILLCTTDPSFPLFFFASLYCFCKYFNSSALLPNQPIGSNKTSKSSSLPSSTFVTWYPAKITLLAVTFLSFSHSTWKICSSSQLTDWWFLLDIKLLQMSSWCASQVLPCKSQWKPFWHICSWITFSLTYKVATCNWISILPYYTHGTESLCVPLSTLSE